jgi:hypothetical protein
LPTSSVVRPSGRQARLSGRGAGPSCRRSSPGGYAPACDPREPGAAQNLPCAVDAFEIGSIAGASMIVLTRGGLVSEERQDTTRDRRIAGMDAALRPGFAATRPCLRRQRRSRRYRVCHSPSRS